MRRLLAAVVVLFGALAMAATTSISNGGWTGTAASDLAMGAYNITTSGRIGPAKSISEDFNALSTNAKVHLHGFNSDTMQTTGGSYSIMLSPGGYRYNVGNVNGTRTTAPVMVAAGLNVAGDLTNGEGYEINTNWAHSDGGAFVVGKDAAFYMKVKFEIADVDGLDLLAVGFRSAETLNANHFSYADIGALGCTAFPCTSPMAVRAYCKLNGVATDTDTTQTLADNVVVQFKVLVSGAGAITFQHDIATPGTLAAPTAVCAQTQDDGDILVPYFAFRHNATLADTLTIHSWEVGYQ